MARLSRPHFVKTSLLGALLLLASPRLAGKAGTAEENLVGIWVMDVQKSVWGQMQRPLSVTLEVVQQGSEIRYSGSVVYQNQEIRTFEFSGAIDGHQYPVMRSYGVGKMVMNRKDSGNLETVYTSDSGVYIETARMVISGDGKHMTRYMSLKYPIGTRSWVEVYNRR